MLGHAHSRPGDDQRGRRREIEGVEPVAARAARVDQGPPGNVDFHGFVSHRLGETGEFLGSEHTMSHFRGEFHEPRLLCRVPRQRWQDAGRRSMRDRARDRAAALLAADRPPLLDEATSRELRDIEKRFLAG